MRNRRFLPLFLNINEIKSLSSFETAKFSCLILSCASKSSEVKLTINGRLLIFTCTRLTNESDLVSIIKNLLDNAIRYTPNGGQVDLSVFKQNNNVILEIEGNGFGIPQKERERVFDAFYRILGNDAQGTGLGLSIVKMILNRLGGRIDLLDSVNFPSGLLVRVYLPSH